MIKLILGSSVGAAAAAAIVKMALQFGFKEAKNAIADIAKNDPYFPEDKVAVEAILAAVKARLPRSAHPAQDISALLVLHEPRLKPLQGVIDQVISALIDMDNRDKGMTPPIAK